jgi:hypothetical protein
MAIIPSEGFAFTTSGHITSMTMDMALESDGKTAFTINVGGDRAPKKKRKKKKRKKKKKKRRRRRRKRRKINIHLQGIMT